MSAGKKSIRKPQQKRSILMTQKIIDAALLLFCEKGYYNTTTNEIAKNAGISVGSLYAYFQDKDKIFLEILKQYHCDFLSVFEKITSKANLFIYRSNKKEWLSVLLNDLVNLHLSVKTLNRELHALYYIKPEVMAIMDEQTEKIKAYTLEFLNENPEDIKTKNVEITVLLMVDFISSIIDRVVYDVKLSTEEKDTMIHVGINAIYKILYE